MVAESTTARCSQASVGTGPREHGRHPAEGGAHEHRRPAQLVGDGHAVGRVGRERVVAVERPLTVTVAPEIERDRPPPVTGDDLGRLTPGVAGLAAPVHEEHGPVAIVSPDVGDEVNALNPSNRSVRVPISATIRSGHVRAQEARDGGPANEDCNAAPTDLPDFFTPRDASANTLDHNARMAFTEPDMAGFAEGAALKAAPGTKWSYANGNPAILARIVRDRVGGHAVHVLRPTVENESDMSCVRRTSSIAQGGQGRHRLLRVPSGPVVDVPSPELGAQNYTSTARLDGGPAVMILIYQLPGSNALDVGKGVRAKMAELAQTSRSTSRQKGDTTMRFMMLVKANKDSGAGVLPSKELVAAMGQFNEEMAKAGVLLAAEGRHASS